MANLSVTGVLSRVRKAKIALQEGNLQSANDHLDELIRSITGHEFICSKCGCQMTHQDFRLGGEYCDTCSK